MRTPRTGSVGRRWPPLLRPQRGVGATSAGGRGGGPSIEAGGRRVATAHGFGRRNRAIEADGVTYHFSRSAPWRHEEKLLDGGRRLGAVRRTSVWRGDAAADLPGLPRVVEVFAIAVVLTRWESDASATG